MIPEPKVKSMPIGVFDSGVGGLSVLQELIRVMPHEEFVFVADQSYVPYGGKTSSQLKKRTVKIVRFLKQQSCKAVVVACNTATVYAIEHLRKNFAIPFIGTVPAVKPACLKTRSGVVAVLSTPATAQSPALKKLVRLHANGAKVLRIGCHGLEDAVETGGVHEPATLELIKKYLAPAIKNKADVLVLGCTHFPFLKQTIRRLSGITTMDGNKSIARQTKSVLGAANLLQARGASKATFYTTGSPVHFARVASQLLGRSVRVNPQTLRL